MYRTTTLPSTLRTAAVLAAWLVAATARAATGPAEPAEVARAFEQRFNAGDADALATLYDPQAVFVPAPGQPLDQPESIGQALRGFLGMSVPMAMTVRHVYRSGDTALLVVDWRMDGRAPDGRPVALSGTGTDVVRRGADGVWRYLIDNPFGGLAPAREAGVAR